MCGKDKDSTPPGAAKDQAEIDKFDKEMEEKKDNFKNGPISVRSCTDRICCLLFLVAIVGFGAASVYGWKFGDPKKLLIGWDSDGNGCGFSDKTLDYPALYWAKPPGQDVIAAVKALDVDAIMELLNTGTCVKDCPAADKEPVQCFKTAKMLLADSGFDNGCTYQLNAAYITSLLGEDVLDDYLAAFYPGGKVQYDADVRSGSTVGGPTFPFRYGTKKMYGFCLPTFKSDQLGGFSEETIETFTKLFQDTVMGDKLTSYIADIAYTWKVIAICTLTCILLAYLYLLLIKYIGGILVWLSILLIQLSLIGGGVYVYFQSDNYPSDHDYHNYMKYAAYVCFGIAGLFLCCICCCWRAIKIGIAVYQTTADFIGSNLRIYLLPFITYIVTFLWFGIWIVSFIWTFSVGEPEAREDYPFITNVKWSDNTRYIVIYQLFMLFWLNAFIMGMCQFIIAASACIWYFEVNSDTQGKGVIGRGIFWGFRYHMGSIAFGAAIIAICQIIRVIFEYYRKKIQSMTQNACVKCMLCYTSYLLYLLEKCIKFITANAYIQVALTNEPFCTSAWNAFCLILRNVAKFGWLNTIGGILNWFGVCCVSGINAFGAYIVLTKMEDFKENVTQPLAPAIVILLISFFITKSFLSIFSFSLDAILQAFLLDETIGFAGQARPDSIKKFKTDLTREAGKPEKE